MQITRPTANYEQQPQRERVAKCVTLQLGWQYYSSMFQEEGGEITVLSVEEILDRAGQVVKPVWEKDWTEAAPGIRTREDTIEIQHFACPVVISYCQQRDRVFVNRRINEERHFTTERFQICYEPE